MARRRAAESAVLMTLASALKGMMTGQTKAATFAGGIPNCQLRRRKFVGIITRMRATAPSPQDATNHATEGCGRRR